MRSEAALETALEQFRALLGLAPGRSRGARGGGPARDARREPVEPLEVLLVRAREHRLELQEARDQVDDARRAACPGQAEPAAPARREPGLRAAPASGPPTATRLRRRRRAASRSTSTPPIRWTTLGAKASKAVADLDVVARERARAPARAGRGGRGAGGGARAGAHPEERRAAEEGRWRWRRSSCRLATLRYQRGLASNFDVVDAEGSLVLARSALVGLLTSYQVARVELQAGDRHARRWPDARRPPQAPRRARGLTA